MLNKNFLCFIVCSCSSYKCSRARLQSGYDAKRKVTVTPSREEGAGIFGYSTHHNNDTTSARSTVLL